MVKSSLCRMLIVKMRNIVSETLKKPTNQRCLLCNSEDKGKLNLLSYLLNDDLICDECRMKLNRVNRIIKTEDLEFKVLYEYNDAMASMLLQYKGGCDEALAPVFMYPDLRWFDKEYSGYTIVYVPSSFNKECFRGFKHLEKIFENSKLDKADILYKIKDVEQKKLDIESRKLMIDNIGIIEDAGIPEKILLVDDVVTSGSSIRGAYCKLALKCSDIKVFCVSCNHLWL